MALREANALAVVGVAAQISLKGDKMEKVAIVLGAVAPTPVFASEASDFLIGKIPSESVFDEAASRAAEAGKPISDIRGSAWYRKELIPVLSRRALDGALMRARERS
jgi:carbon-monoxide dehydrogenase medium subunit